MHSLLRGSLRTVRRRKAETLVIILLMMIGTGFLAGIALDSANFQRYMVNGMVDTLGHISFFGVFDESVRSSVEELPGVSRARLYYWVAAVMIDENGSKTPVVLLDSSVLDNPLIKADRQPGPREAILYRSVSGFTGPAGISMKGTVHIYTYNWTAGRWQWVNLTLVGEARGIASFAGDTPVLVVDRGLLQNLTGGRPTWLAVWSDEPSDAAIDRVASSVRSVLDREGYTVYGVWVNHVERNPFAMMISSMTSFIDPYLYAAIILVAVLSSASGMMLLARSTREIAVLRSIGVTARGLAIFYMLPWLLRIVAGGLLGALIAPTIGLRILAATMGKGGMLDILLSAYGFQRDIGTLATYTLLATILASLGALIPGVAAARIRPATALRFYGLKTVRTIRLRAPHPIIRLHIRDLFSRPWRLAGMVLAASIVLGAAVGASFFNDSLSLSVDSYWASMEYDIILYTRPSSQAVGQNLSHLYTVLNNRAIVESYQVMLCSIADYIPSIDRTVAVVAMEKGSEISFKVLEGRMPGPGEAVISLSLSKLIGKNIGDTITIKTRTGETINLRITGIGIDKCDNFYVWTNITDYHTITSIPLDKEERIVYIKTHGTPADTAKKLVQEINKDPTLTASYKTRAELRENSNEGLKTFSAITYGFTLVSLIIGVGVITSLVLLDLASRQKELAVRTALGITRRMQVLGVLWETLLVIILALPLSTVIGYLIAKYDQATLLMPMGYIPLVLRLEAVFSRGLLNAVLAIIIVTLLLTYIHIKRIKIGQTLRQD